MNPWDEEALKEIGNLDAARLAIRGALATIRDLQDQNARLKTESDASLQDEAARRKALESRVKELTVQVDRWQEQAKAWEAEQKHRATDEARWKGTVRMQVRAEENARIEESRRALEEHLARLQAELQQMAAGQRDNEGKWADVRKRLEQREHELVASEREKLEIANRARHDADLLASLREQRDREISASIRGREVELEDKSRELSALRRQVEELQKAQAAAGQQLELQVREREDKLARLYREKEKTLQERFGNREMELQSSWADLENGLWKRAKEARDKLDEAAQGQFVERARALADRSKEIELLLASRKKELDEDFEKRCAEAESRYAQNERRLLDGWTRKENKFLGQYELELSHEKALLEQAHAARSKELESEHESRRRALDDREATIASDLKRREERALEEAARREAERVRQNDDFIARKAAELELAAAQRASALQEEDARRAAAGREEISRLKTELLERAKAESAAEKESLERQLEQHRRALEEGLLAKAAQLDRAHQESQELFNSWKAGVVAESLRKEQTLDARWFGREQELVRQCETSLEKQRQSFAAESHKTAEQLERQREREREELAARLAAVSEDYARRERALREEIARREGEQSLKREKESAEWRAHYQAALERQSAQAAEEAARLRADQAQQLAALRERHQSDLNALRDRAQVAELDSKSLSGQLASAAEQLKAARVDLEQRQRAWEAERLQAQAQAQAREAEREKRYQELEQSLQALWTNREAAAVAARLQALENQHRHYQEQLAKAERQKAEWLGERERELASKRAELEAERQSLQQEPLRRPPSP